MAVNRCGKQLFEWYNTTGCREQVEIAMAVVHRQYGQQIKLSEYRWRVFVYPTVRFRVP